MSDQPKPTTGDPEDHPLYFPHRDMEPERIGPSPYPPDPKPTTGERPSILSDTRKFLNNVYEAGKSATATTTGEQANIHIEYYFPKGYDPDSEPWKSIRKLHNAAVKEAYEKGRQDGISGK